MSDPYVNALNPQRINSCCHAMTFGTVWRLLGLKTIKHWDACVHGLKRDIHIKCAVV